MPRTAQTSTIDTPGRRLARLRKARGLTQAELAVQLDTIQGVISDYESDRRRMHAELVVRLAQVLKVSADELLGLKKAKGAAGHGALSLKLTRRLQRIERLPPARQKLVLQTLDTLLKGAGQ
jgi:transcriptional regulator with XRE-family HTH domain